MLFLYDLTLFFYKNLLRCAALFHPKAKAWSAGRNNIFQQIERQLSTTNNQRLTSDRIWLHCASLGEFEQGRPLIEKIKQEQPATEIILTFFSPSGYEIRKNYSLADHVFYLPLDSRKNARQFVDLIRPTTVIFVKYEFWYHYLRELHNRQIPTYLISAIFRPTQPFFRWYGGLHRKMLRFFTQIFVQNNASANLLQSIDIHNFSIVGDTRVDRVKNIADHAPNFPLAEQFLQTKNVLVAGSTWAADEAILVDFINKHSSLNWQFIFAPHEVDANNIARLKKSFRVPTVLYSTLKNAANQQVTNRNVVLIIDNIGMLSALYQYAKVAYVGGGFGKAIHNILEPIAFGIPVLFGPRHTSFHEALTLKVSGGGVVVTTEDEFAERFHQLQQVDFYQKAAENAKLYIAANLGATQTIYHHIFDVTVEK